MSAHDGLARTRFGDIYFPGETHTVHGDARVHVHEYPHTPGGAPEKLGRALYHVTIRGNFQDRFVLYPDLYPNGMNALRKDFETQTTRQLVHPTVGVFPAFIKSWTQVKDARLRSGEKVDIEFIEDQQTQFLATAIAKITPKEFVYSQQQLNVELSAVRAQLNMGTHDQTIFDALNNGMNAIQAISDTSALYGNRLAIEVQRVANICQQLDNLASMQDPRAYPVVNAIHAIWAAAVAVQKDIQAKQIQMRQYVVPTTMPLARIATLLFKDASKASDLAALNAAVIPDPLNVRAGTVLNYYPPQTPATTTGTGLVQV